MGPFFSIIIPTHNNAEHIAQAINSCFDSEFTDFEIIVINDASTDSTKEIALNILSSKTQASKILTNCRKLGAGPSRNIGVAHAQGDYILFLDGDDWYEKNSIAIAADTAKKTKAEVIIFNHQRIWPDNTKSVNLPNKYTNLQLKEKDLSNIEDRKDALKNLHTVWNKIYKKRYIKKINIKFDTGLYQDMPWSIKALCSAETVYYNPTVLINYRQRKGAVTKNKGKEHFQVFEQANKAISFIRHNKEHSKNYSIEVYTYCRLIIFGVIKTNYRIPQSEVSVFLKTAHKVISQWKKEFKIKGFDIPLLSLVVRSRRIFMLTQEKIKHKI